MGIAVAGDQMAVATRHEIVLLSDGPRLTPSHPRQPDVHDSLHVPRSVHYCGALDVHDLVFTPNGIACDGGAPRDVRPSAAAIPAKAGGAGMEEGGVLIDLASGEIALGGLAMPHSPRLVDGTLDALLSSTSELVHVDPARGSDDVVRKLKGFVRGLDSGERDGIFEDY